MAYRDLNSDRFFYLLAKGTHEGELKRFFNESKRQLLMRQAKVQNLPYGRKDRIRFLCDRLPRSTDDIVRAWFHTNITMVEPTPVDAVVSDFALYEQMSEQIPEEQEKQLARSALVHLFADDPSAALIMFLKSRIGKSSDQDSQEQSLSPDETDVGLQNQEDEVRVDPSGIESASADDLATLLFAVIVGDEQAIDEALVPYTDGVQTLVDALLCARNGDTEGAVSLSKTLPQDAHEYKLLQRALSQARHRPGSSATVSPGLRVVVPQPLKEHYDLAEFDIIGVCSNEADKVVFVRPLALVSGSSVFLLTAEDRIGMFPESGDVMSHRLAGRRLPHRGDIVRWTVSEREDSVGKTKFHYVDEPSPMVEVISVPFPSSAPDEVRNYIRELMLARKSVVLPYPMFALSDGVTIAPPKSADPKREDAYEQPWQSWRSLDVWLIEGRQLSMGVPEVPASQLDLSPLEAAFKKLVKNLVEEQKATVTKAQVRHLATLIRSQPVGELRLRAARVADALERVALDNESIEALLPVLGAREEVRQRVDEIVEQNVNEKAKERSGLITEIESLRSKHADLQRDSKDLERRIRKQAGDVEASVEKAFSRAIEDGVASLAKAEIFRTLSLSHVDRSTPTGGNQRDHQALTVCVKNGSITREDGISRLVAAGFKRRHATALTGITQVMGKVGGCLVLRGQDARQLTRVLGQIDSETCGILEIPMGLTSSHPLRNALADATQELGAILLLDADLSPIDIYGSPLFDRAYDSAVGEGQFKTRILISCVGGDMALPIPRSIRRVAVVIDLDSPWDQQERLLGELEEDDIPLIKPMYAALFEEVSQLQGAERNMVEAALATALCASGC